VIYKKYSPQQTECKPTTPKSMKKMQIPLRRTPDTWAEKRKVFRFFVEKTLDKYASKTKLLKSDTALHPSGRGPAAARTS